VDATLYPEIAQAGGLASWLRAEFDGLGLPYRPRPRDNVVGTWRSAVVDDGKRSTEVLLTFDKRQFIVWLAANGEQMAAGPAPSLSAVVAITRMWQSGQRLREVAAAWPLFGSVEMAEARERGDVAEHRWRRLYEDPWPVYPLGALRSFIEAAFHTPRLRALVPLTSGHFTMMRFAPAGGPPYGQDGPSVRSLAKDRYVVCAADGRELGVADATGSVALVLSELDRMAGGPDPT
jgi:hypothetical protein